eukprot:2636467-Pleurochrysis_carterae.AAC.4
MNSIPPSYQKTHLNQHFDSRARLKSIWREAGLRAPRASLASPLRQRCDDRRWRMSRRRQRRR